MASTAPGLEKQNAKVGILAFLGACAMLGLGYAAVPLYELFCRVTGFGGTTQVAFDASTGKDIPWLFKPQQTTDTVQIGIRDMAIYTARNDSDEPITGTATFNVEPEQAGKYFHKIQCFCFTEQTLQPGQEVQMPVLYYIDPAILEDENAKDVEQITLSYTFHRAIEPES